jgi:hypothetical protein
VTEAPYRIGLIGAGDVVQSPDLARTRDYERTFCVEVAQSVDAVSRAAAAGTSVSGCFARAA